VLLVHGALLLALLGGLLCSPYSIPRSAANHVCRRNDPPETDPLKLNLCEICSLDDYGGCLFVPDWSDDLIVLEKSA